MERLPRPATVQHLGHLTCQSHSQTSSVKGGLVQQPYRLSKQVQAEVLRRRRGNTWQKDVSARRADVRKYETDPEYKKKVLPVEGKASGIIARPRKAVDQELSNVHSGFRQFVA